MMHGGGEREGEWEEIKKVSGIGALEPFLFSRSGGKWRTWGVSEHRTDIFFRGFSTLFENYTISTFLPLCLSIA